MASAGEEQVSFVLFYLSFVFSFVLSFVISLVRFYFLGTGL